MTQADAVDTANVTMHKPYVPGLKNFDFHGTLTIGAAGAVTASFPGVVDSAGSALFSCAHTDTGIYTLTCPTAPFGVPQLTIASDTIDTIRIDKASYAPATGSLVIHTFHDDGTSGVPALADPAETDVIYVSLHLRWL